MAFSSHLALHHLLAVASLSPRASPAKCLREFCLIGLKGSSSVFYCASAVLFTLDFMLLPLAPELLIHLGSNVPHELLVPSLELSCSPQLSRCACTPADHHHRPPAHWSSRTGPSCHKRWLISPCRRRPSCRGACPTRRRSSRPQPFSRAPCTKRLPSFSSASSRLYLEFSQWYHPPVLHVLHPQRDLNLAVLLLGMGSLFSSWV
mmetsp:Transcript_80465/g.204559  ORF Transcript_80465/g.204559 Transcript_80465/m.204559 type:complete len:205 (-) Transcript_80465:108-722(-)